MSEEQRSAVSSNGILAESLETEVRGSRKPRKFTPAFKLAFLKQAETCTKPGELGALLRRAGLYSSTLADWKRQRAKGQLDGRSPQKPGPKADPSAREIARLTRDNRKLAAQLEQARTIISVQKKLSRLLGLSLSEDAEP